jgi:hypothetical protein
MFHSSQPDPFGALVISRHDRKYAERKCKREVKRESKQWRKGIVTYRSRCKDRCPIRCRMQDMHQGCVCSPIFF